jgi:hypothetical protein
MTLFEERLVHALKTAKTQLITLGGDNRPDPHGDQMQAAILDLVDAALETPVDLDPTKVPKWERLHTILKRFIDHGVEEKPSPGRLTVTVAPRDMKELRSAFEPFRHGLPSSKLSDYSDAAIANEHHRRAMLVLGDPRIGVGMTAKDLNNGA